MGVIISDSTGLMAMRLSSALCYALQVLNQLVAVGHFWKRIMKGDHWQACLS
jgi:hypothetical protein